MCVALITFHVCNLYCARDHAYIDVAQEGWTSSSVCVSLCELVCMYCVSAVTQAINFVTNPRAEVPAQ